MSLDYPGLLADLRTESDCLTAQLANMPAEEWGRPTPAAGWNIHDQVSHLAFFDDAARLAATDPGEFRVLADKLVTDGADFTDRIAENHRILPSDALLDWFVRARNDVLAVVAENNPKRRLPWFGPDMSVASSVTARLMETWAHGQDVYDALGVVHPPSPGLRSIAHLGVATFAFTHTLNNLEVPAAAPRVELCSPSGEVWVWGPVDAAERVTGSALGFVLTVTQRRNWTETDLVAVGTVASRWLDIAQAFAGAPSRRQPRVTES